MSQGFGLRGVSKSFGSVGVLHDITFTCPPAHVTCLLGDNGAGKSTIIKILAGVEQPDSGEIVLDGEPLHLASPRDALRRGVATVFQDLAVVPILPIYRNFVMGAEPTRGVWPFRILDRRRALADSRAELEAIGVELDDFARPIATLSGGQRQCVAIARAVHRGARFLILDEPTSALGVKQSQIVLDYVQRMRDRGIGVLLVTHNPSHALEVGSSFILLERGRVVNHWAAGEIDREELIDHMSGRPAPAAAGRRESR